MRTKKQKYKKKFSKISLTKLFLLTILFLVVAQVVLSNSLATSGARLKALNEKIRQLELENQRLSSEIAQKASLTDILAKAKEKGFVREPKVVNLDRDGVVALKPDL